MRNRFTIPRRIVQIASFFLVNYLVFEIIWGIKLTYLEPIVKVLPFLQTPADPWSPGAGFLEYLFYQITQGVFPYLLFGLIILFSLFGGRVFCGWACPTGFIQELLNQLPSQTKMLSIKTDRTTKKVKYGILLLLAIIFVPLGLLHGTANGFDYAYSLGVFAQRPVSVFSLSDFIFAFCPQMIQEMVKEGGVTPLFVSALGAFQFFAFIVVIILSAYYNRFYCRVLCPYGAAIGYCSEFGFVHLARNPVRCPGRRECGMCERVCPIQIRIMDERWEGFTGGGECILCLKCKEECPHSAIYFRFG